MMKTTLNTLLSSGRHFCQRPFSQESGWDLGLYFACLACFVLVVAAGKWIAEYGAEDQLEIWIASSAAFLALAMLTRFSTRLRG